MPRPYETPERRLSMAYGRGRGQEICEGGDSFCDLMRRSGGRFGADAVINGSGVGIERGDGLVVWRRNGVESFLSSFHAADAGGAGDTISAQKFSPAPPATSPPSSFSPPVPVVLSVKRWRLTFGGCGIGGR